MKYGSVKVGMAAAMLCCTSWLSAASGEEVAKNYSVSLQHGWYIGADSLHELSTEPGASSESLLFAAGRIGWSRSFDGLSFDAGAGYESAGDITDGVINMHTQFTRTISASGGHNLGLSMRLNVAAPIAEIESSSVSVLASFSDVWEITDTVSLSQNVSLAMDGAEPQRGTYGLFLSWKPNNTITVELPLTAGVPLSDEGGVDVSVSGRVKMLF